MHGIKGIDFAASAVFALAVIPARLVDDAAIGLSRRKLHHLRKQCLTVVHSYPEMCKSQSITGQETRN